MKTSRSLVLFFQYLIPILFIEYIALPENVSAKPPALVYELSIGDSTYDVVESEPFTLELEPSKIKLTAQIKVKQIQPYDAGNWTFSYDRTFSLQDDFAANGKARSIKLIHGSGISLVVTDQGRTDNKNGKELLQLLQDRLISMFQRDGGKEFKKSEIKPVSFKHVKGSASTFSYVSPDSDVQFCEIYVLNDGKQEASVIVQYEEEEKKDAAQYANITLNSIVGNK